MNKKRIALAVFLCLLTLVLSSVLFACDLETILYGDDTEQEEQEDAEKEDEETCVHEWQLSTNGIRSTCQREGYDLYICTKCNKEDRRPLPLSGHLFTNNVCVYCGTKAPTVSTFKEANVTVSMYYAVGISANDDEKDKEYQLIFEGDGNLSSVLWSKYRTKIRTIKIEGRVGLPDNAFSGDTILSEINVTGTVTRIGKKAFSGCTSLVSVDFPAVEYVGENAFEGCTYLQSATIGGSPYIGQGVFSGCDYLQTLSLPDVGTERERYTAQLKKGMSVSFTECNSLGVVLNAGGSKNYIASGYDVSMEESKVALFDELSVLYRYFMTVDAVTGLRGTWQPEIGGNDYTKYARFFDKVTELFDASNGTLAKVARYGVKTGMIVGIDDSYDILFNKEYYYVSESSPVASDLKTLYEEKAGGGYVLTKDETIVENKRYYREYAKNYYVAVSSPSADHLQDYYELTGGLYVRTKDKTIKSEKTYYRVCAYEDYLTVAMRLFGYTNMVNFLGNAGNLSIAYIVNSAHASANSIAERLIYDGAVCTSDGSFILPYAIESDLSDTILALVIIDGKGKISIWIDNVEEAFKAVNFYDKTLEKDVELVVSGRNVLFENMRATSMLGSIFSQGSKTNYNQFWEDTYYRIPTSLRSITITNAKTIEPYAFANISVKIENVVFGAGLEEIGHHAFYNCSGIEHISFAENSRLTVLEEFAFEGCEGLVSFVLPKGVSVLPQSAFSRCSKLEKFDFEDGSTLTSIKSDVFFNCFLLTSITLPEGLESVGSNAFSGCSSLQNVYLGQNLRVLGTNSFYDCSALKDVYLATPDVANVENNSSCIFGSSTSFSLWIEQSITVSSLSYVGKNYACLMSDHTTEIKGKRYYLWQKK